MNEPLADENADKKIHPRAKDCLFISLIPSVIYACIDVSRNNNLGDIGLAKTLILLFLISCMLQPVGLWLGVCSLYEIKKGKIYSGEGYAIAGIIISIMMLCGGFLTMF